MSHEYKTFLYSYNFDGARWGFELQAKDFQEAERRLSMLPLARLDGELKATLPVGMGWLARMICWWKA